MIFFSICMAKRSKKKARKQRKKSITKNSSTKKFNIIDVGGGGDCFYRVIAHQLGMNPNQFMQIRSKISEYININKDSYLPFFENSEEFTNFVNSIKKKGNWCEGEIEMQSVCNLYNVDLHVYGDNGNINKFTSDNTNKIFRIYHEVDIHFKSIVD